jgi:hypothetical protein
LPIAVKTGKKREHRKNTEQCRICGVFTGKENLSYAHADEWVWKLNNQTNSELDILAITEKLQRNIQQIGHLKKKKSENQK